jgi:hypothetical protein
VDQSLTGYITKKELLQTFKMIGITVSPSDYDSFKELILDHSYSDGKVYYYIIIVFIII